MLHMSRFHCSTPAQVSGLTMTFTQEELAEVAQLRGCDGRPLVKATNKVTVWFFDDVIEASVEVCRCACKQEKCSAKVFILIVLLR